MRALKCDNCGGYYDYNVRATAKIGWYRLDGSVVKDQDICPECMAAVAKALDDRKKIEIQKKTDPFEDDMK